jgi:hypothetical protein
MKQHCLWYIHTTSKFSSDNKGKKVEFPPRGEVVALGAWQRRYKQGDTHRLASLDLGGRNDSSRLRRSLWKDPGPTSGRWQQRPISLASGGYYIADDSPHPIN